MPRSQQQQQDTETTAGPEPTLAGPSNEAQELAGRAAIQRITAQDGPLAQQQAQAAVAQNRAANFNAASWGQIGRVVGVASSVPDVGLVQAIASWQAQSKLRVTGVCDDITVQWLSQAPGGDGLQDLVKHQTTMYMGLNPASSPAEVRTLSAKAPSGDFVNQTGDLKHQGAVQVGPAWVGLETPQGIASAVASLPQLAPDLTKTLIDFLAARDPHIRDETFNMIRYLWTVETGKGLLKRVVLSGHSNAKQLWGGDSQELGVILYVDLLDMFRLFPRASGEVEHLAFSACFSNWPDAVDRYRAVFPNLKTIWGYAQWSPNPATGSTHHLDLWNASTRTHQGKEIDAARKLVAMGHGTRDQNVAIWSVESGYQTNVDTTTMYNDLVASIAQRQGDFDVAMRKGTLNMTALNALYADLQLLVHQHAQEAGSELERYHTMLQQTLYLREWEAIVNEFTSKHGADLATVHSASSLRFQNRSRKEILDAIASFQPKESEQSVYRAMCGVLRDLDPTQIQYGRL